MSSFEFNTVYDLTGESVRAFAPDVMHDPAGDVIVSDGWRVITGITGQYGYRGAVMHPSETMTDAQVIAAVRDREGSRFCIVEVQDEDGSYPDGDPIGWAIAYR